MAWGHRTVSDDDQRPGIGFAGPEPWPIGAPPGAAAIALDLRPTLLVAGRADAAARLATIGERAGLRCIGQVAPDALADRLSLLVAVDLILIDLRGECGAELLDGRTVRLLAARPGLESASLAIVSDMAGLDWAMARLDARNSEFLCEPRDIEIVSLLVMAAISAEANGQGVRFHDATRDGDAARIDRLSEEVRRLAATIERLTRDTDEAQPSVMEPRGAYRAEQTPAAEPRTPPLAHAATDAANGGNSGTPSHAEIRALLRARRLREQFLPGDLFADPAWDMMLDLMAARLCGQRVSVSSLCIAAAVPPTTALRWIRQLTDRGVFARIDDPADGRRVFIELTEEAASSLSLWTQAVRKNGGLLGGGVHH